ncbi:MAG: TSUP family transporter [Flavitalea sp.]
MNTETEAVPGVATNHLFPIFLKLEELSVLLVGGGNVALEKLSAIFSNAPLTRVHVVATNINDHIHELTSTHFSLTIDQRPYISSDLENADIVVIAVNNKNTSEIIRNEAKERGKLVNVADTPELCDFYLGSIVKKGNLKIAISTNGKSPTIAKRLKDILNEAVPEEIDEVLENMQVIRQKLRGNFADKVSKLNTITKDLALKNEIDSTKGEKKWRRIATYSLIAFCFMIIGHILFSYIPFSDIVASVKTVPSQLEPIFYWMIAAGFLAQLVDGALGMGYGVTCTTILLSLGVNLPVISGSIHTAEMFSSGMSGYSHYKFGNVNKKLFKALLIPGVIGSVAGAVALWVFGVKYADYVRPILAGYTLILGVKILYSAYRKAKPQKVKRVGWLAGAGGFLDSFGGGGWGPLVTSTLISKGRTPRYVIGSVSISEFFVTLASALTFFGLIGISHWQIIIGLIIGGMIAAPIAAKLAGKLPLKTMFVCVGSLVIIWSLRIILKSLHIM